MLLAAVAGFNKLVYLFFSICLHGIDWHNFILASVNVRNKSSPLTGSFLSTKELFCHSIYKFYFSVQTLQ